MVINAFVDVLMKNTEGRGRHFEVEQLPQLNHL